MATEEFRCFTHVRRGGGEDGGGGGGGEGGWNVFNAEVLLLYEPASV